MQPKDIIIAINGNPIKYFDEAQHELDKFKNQDISITVKRASRNKRNPGKSFRTRKLGVGFGQLTFKDLEKLGYYDLADIDYSFAEAIPAGWNKSWKTLTDYVKQLKKIFNPSTGAYKGLGGFISIGSIFPSEWSAAIFLEHYRFLIYHVRVYELTPNTCPRRWTRSIYSLGNDYW